MRALIGWECLAEALDGKGRISAEGNTDSM